jgi:hypothetical protein
VLGIEPLFNETRTSNTKLVVGFNLNYNYLRKIKYYFPHLIVQVLTWSLIANILFFLSIFLSVFKNKLNSQWLHSHIYIDELWQEYSYKSDTSLIKII